VFATLITIIVVNVICLNRFSLLATTEARTRSGARGTSLQFLGGRKRKVTE